MSGVEQKSPRQFDVSSHTLAVLLKHLDRDLTCKVSAMRAEVPEATHGRNVSALSG